MEKTDVLVINVFLYIFLCVFVRRPSVKWASPSWESLPIRTFCFHKRFLSFYVSISLDLHLEYLLLYSLYKTVQL